MVGLYRDLLPTGRHPRRRRRRRAVAGAARALRPNARAWDQNDALERCRCGEDSLRPLRGWPGVAVVAMGMSPWRPSRARACRQRRSAWAMDRHAGAWEARGYCGREGDASADIAALKRVSLVMRDGRVIHRASAPLAKRPDRPRPSRPRRIGPSRDPPGAGGRHLPSVTAEGDRLPLTTRIAPSTAGIRPSRPKKIVATRLPPTPARAVSRQPRGLRGAGSGSRFRWR